jgi:hypothetical protein
LLITGVGAPRKLLALRAFPVPVPGARAMRPPLNEREEWWIIDRSDEGGLCMLRL